MNCFAHGFRYLDDPYFLVGTALPDWLTLVDRKVRVRERMARRFWDADDSSLRQLARGIVRHHQDDAKFHSGIEFVTMNLELALELRRQLGTESGFRPHFVAHIVIEMLLDASLALRDSTGLNRYYGAVERVDPASVQNTVNQMAATPTSALEHFIPRFIQESYLFDYFEDDRIIYRVNRILHRVNLLPLPDSVIDWVSTARVQVYDQTDLLLAPVLSS